MNKRIQFQLRGGLITAEVKNGVWSFYAYKDHTKYDLSRAQYMTMRHQAGLPKEITFSYK